MFESQYETMPRTEIVQLQLERLQATLSRVYRNVKFYRQQVDQIGFLPVEILSLREGHQDFLEIKVEVRESIFFDPMVDQRLMVNLLSKKLAQGIGVTPRVKLVEPDTIDRSGETSLLVIDRR